MSNWIYYILPVFSALTGWIVVWTLFKFSLPKIKKQLPVQLGELIRTELASALNIGKEFSDPSNLQNILPLIETHIDDFLKNKLPVEMPMISMFVGEKTIGTLKQSFLKEMQLLFPEVMQAYAKGLKKKLDSQVFIQEKLGSRMALFEEKIEQKLRPQFRSAGLVGALAGFVSGLLLVSLLLLLN